MFDNLIETEPEGANFHTRRSYFMVSSVVVGVLFITAVVISIYASDYGLGSGVLELSVVVAPPEVASPDPQPLPPRLTANPAQSQNPLLSKPTFVAPLDDPKTIPTAISTTPDFSRVWSNELPRPESDSSMPDGTERDQTAVGSDSVGIGTAAKPADSAPDTEPPPVKKPADTKPPILRSEGPINGKATYLPKPPYPAVAIAANIQGKVDVQVMIDENGKVVSANAVSGHPFLRGPAERAAWNAKFSPTYLSKVPVKVTGVIVYNFTR